VAKLLISQKNPAGVEGLAAVVHLGAPRLALIKYGEVAVTALLKVARTEPEEQLGQAPAAMESLLGRLESSRIQPTLSPASLAGIRQVAAQRLTTARGNDGWPMLAAAATLAVATGDQKLRKQVEDLVDNNGEFVRRGMDLEWQQEVSKSARQALAKSRAVP
jgi:hypothetical protein